MNAESGQARLYGAVLNEVLDALDRQLSEMDFFAGQGSDDVKLKHAPLTNLGCESEFAKLDNRITFSGGSTTVRTHSRKNVVSTDKLLKDSSFTDLSEDEKLKKWKWARCSEEVAQVKKLEQEFIAKVKTSQQLALLKKQEAKKKKMSKVLLVLEECKKHGGPVTPISLDSLERLNESQLLKEIGYLRSTVAPDIRQKRRVKCTDGTKTFTFEKFSVDELKTSIRNAVKPEDNVSVDVDILLKKVL